jgi:glycosyltransferase involved in cell wall biosynthesis
VEPRKNLLTLLTAFKLFCLKNPTSNQQLILVGELGWKAEALVQALENHPFRARIIRLGYVDFADLPILYTHSKALIYPSEYEGFGLPIIEALACGTPVIAAKNSSLVEIGEGAAIFFPTHDAQALSEKMARVIAQPPSKELLILHATQFSWTACASGFMALVEGITGE